MTLTQGQSKLFSPFINALFFKTLTKLNVNTLPQKYYNLFKIKVIFIFYNTNFNHNRPKLLDPQLRICQDKS